MRRDVFSEEHEMFRAQFRRFAEREIEPKIARWNTGDFLKTPSVRPLSISISTSACACASEMENNVTATASNVLLIILQCRNDC